MAFESPDEFNKVSAKTETGENVDSAVRLLQCIALVWIVARLLHPIHQKSTFPLSQRGQGVAALDLLPVADPWQLWGHTEVCVQLLFHSVNWAGSYYRIYGFS